ncbi:hypothetical protein Emed_002946 [Eimeria media]
MKFKRLTFTFVVAASVPLCTSSTVATTESNKINNELQDQGPDKVPAEPEKAEANPTATRVSCLDEINPYREAAGLTGFKSKKILPLPEDEAGSPQEKEVSEASEFLKSVCQPAKTRESKAPAETEATYAVHTQTGTTASCSAAVDYWKGAIANFELLPPKHDHETDVYHDRRNVSFVALFNPQPNPEIDCAYVTCPKQTEGSTDDSDQDLSAGGALPGSPPSAGVLGSRSAKAKLLREAGGDDVAENTHILLCVTQPVALTEKVRPFNEDEFNKITDSLKNSASFASPVAITVSAMFLIILTTS